MMIKESNRLIDDLTKEETKEHNPHWPQIPNHPYGILIIGGSGSGRQIYYLI